MNKHTILSSILGLLCTTLILSCSKDKSSSHHKEDEEHEKSTSLEEGGHHEESEAYAAKEEHSSSSHGGHGGHVEKDANEHEKKSKPVAEADDNCGVGEHSKKNKRKNRKPASEDHIHANEKMPTNVVPETAFKFLRNGNIRYLSKSGVTKGENVLLRADGISQADRDKLVTTQKPHSIILSCSDSRVPPEVIFDQKLGEIFVVRTAGESLDHAVIASIEYAVDHLGASLLLVMGHESCGAVNASLEYTKDKKECDKNHDSQECQYIHELSPSLEALVKEISPRVEKFVKWKKNSYTPYSQSLKVETRANAEGVALKLLKVSNIIKENVESGRMEIRTAVYSLHSGKVEFFSKVEP